MASFYERNNTMVRRILTCLLIMAIVAVSAEGIAHTVNTYNAWVFKNTQLLQAQKELVEAHTRLLEEETLLLVKQRKY